MSDPVSAHVGEREKAGFRSSFLLEKGCSQSDSDDSAVYCYFLLLHLYPFRAG